MFRAHQETWNARLCSPPIVLSKAFEDANRELELETVIPDLAKATLLTTEEVKMWFDHLQLVKDRCKEGAKKAKDTRAKKKGMCYKNVCAITERQLLN